MFYISLINVKCFHQINIFLVGYLYDYVVSVRCTFNPPPPPPPTNIGIYFFLLFCFCCCCCCCCFVLFFFSVIWHLLGLIIKKKKKKQDQAKSLENLSGGASAPALARPHNLFMVQWVEKFLASQFNVPHTLKT